MSLLSALTIFILLAGGKAWRMNRPIVGGEDCEMGEFPFVASLRSVTYDDLHECGCTILNQAFLLTAAHCVAGASPKDFTVRYGFRSISDASLKVVNVAEIILHEEQISYDSDNDIALLKVVPDIKLSACVKPVELPKDYSSLEDDTPAIAIGWGSDENGTFPDTLQKVDIFIASKSRCKEMYKAEFGQTNLCAGSKESGKDSCQGDSGGPLLANGIQVGIVSRGNEKCGGKPYSGVYTDVSFYLNWIAAKLAAHGYTDMEDARKDGATKPIKKPSSKHKNLKKCFKFGLFSTIRFLLGKCFRDPRSSPFFL